MSSFKYKILVINGITKICDDNLYLYNNYLIEYQWNSVQLKYIINNCIKNQKYSSIDKITNKDLSNNELANVIKEYKNDNPNKLIISSDFEKDIEMGIIPKKTKNIISINNLGGKLQNNIEINDNYEFSDDLIIYKYSSEKEDHTKDIINPGDIFTIDKLNLDGDQQPSSTDDIPKEHDMPKEDDKSLDIIKNYGKLNWNNNSCWLDSVLTMLFYPIFNGKINNIIEKNIINKTFNDEKTYLCQLLNSVENSVESKRINLAIFNEIKTIYHKLSNSKKFKTKNLLEYISKCPKTFFEYRFGNLADPIDFFTIIINLFDIKTISYNTETQKYINKDGNVLKTTNINYDVDNDTLSIINIDSSYIDGEKDINSFLFDEEITDFEIQYSTIDRYDIEKDKMGNPIKVYIIENKKKNSNEGEISFEEALNSKIAFSYKYLKTIKVINKTDNLIITLGRNYELTRSINDNELIPTKSLKLSENDFDLELVGIIVYIPGHYITFINSINSNKDNTWYVIDDTNQDTPIIIGGYEKLLSYRYSQINNIIITNSVLFWYSKIN